jgi:hypothetical protein
MSAPAGKAARAILVPMQEPIAAIRGFDSFDAHEAFVFMERNVEMGVDRQLTKELADRNRDQQERCTRSRPLRMTINKERRP